MQTTPHQAGKLCVLSLLLGIWILQTDATGQEPRYVWHAGDLHHYSLSIDTEFEDTQIDIDGTIELRVKGLVADSTSSAGKRLPATQSGFGFLIDSNHLITSSSLVDQAETITIEISGESVSAKSVKTDPLSNLTLLQLDKAVEFTAPSVPAERSIEKSDRISVLNLSAQHPAVVEARVTGYRNKNGRFKFFAKADAESGLLGAPIIDQAGHFIGMVSGIPEHNQTGWTIAPSPEFHQLVKSKSISLSQAESEPLNETELIEHCQPQVATINVVRKRTGNPLSRIDFTGSYHTKTFSRRRFEFPDFPERESDSGELFVSESGQIIRFEGEEHLPFLLGPLGSFPIELLNHEGKSSWEEEIQTAVATIEELGPFGFYGLPSHFRTTKRQVSSTTAATEKITYELAETDSHLIEINKNYQLVTLDHTEHPSIRFTGEGKLQFDTQLNVIVSSQFTGTLERNTKNTTLRLPIKVSLIRKTAEQLAAERKAAKERAEAARIERETPFTEAEMASIMEDLKSGDKQKQNQAMFRLISKSPREGSPELTRLLVDKIEDKEFARMYYRGVLEKWATPDVGPELLKQIPDTDNHFLRRTMMTLVAKFQTEGAAEILVPYLKSRSDRMHVERLLIKLGSSAEEPTLQYAEDSDRWVRHSVIAVLQAVGTEKSLPALESMAENKSDRILQHSAQRAVESIKARQ